MFFLSSPGRRRLQCCLQLLGPLRLISQRLEELADSHFLAVQPWWRHVELRTSAVFWPTSLTDARDTTILMTPGKEWLDNKCSVESLWRQPLFRFFCVLVLAFTSTLMTSIKESSCESWSALSCSSEFMATRSFFSTCRRATWARSKSSSASWWAAMVAWIIRIYSKSSVVFPQLLCFLVANEIKKKSLLLFGSN